MHSIGLVACVECFLYYFFSVYLSRKELSGSHCLILSTQQPYEVGQAERE